jgi:hypothetical protein
MSDADDFARSLMEEAKRFYEKARESSDSSGTKAYLHACITIAFCALEAHVNCVADDFLTRSELDVLERSILSERNYKLERGQFVLENALRMYRLEDRYEFLFFRFSGHSLDRSQVWWGRFIKASQNRNALVHPKSALVLTLEMAKEAVESILNAINHLYEAVYKRPYPPNTRGLDSSLTF